MDSQKKRITIVCEGYEECDYLKRLKECSVWNDNYVVNIKNAKSLSNVFAVYSNEFSNKRSELILVFCDTEMVPCEQYKLLCKKINRFHNKRTIDKSLVFFSNPCTMQIILMHFGCIKLTTNKKTQNARMIKDFTGIKDYHAEENQRKSLMNHINASNYEVMKRNIATISSDDSVIPSTNIGDLLEKLENAETTWVDKLIAKVES